MKTFTSKLVILLAPLAMSCETTNEAAGLGSATGSIFGGGIGALVNDGGSRDLRIRNVAIGATSGALLGAGLGYGAQNEIQSREKQAFNKGKDSGRRELTSYVGNNQQPNLIPPQVEVIYVEDQIKGQVFVPAHIEYRIIQPAHWEKQ